MRLINEQKGAKRRNELNLEPTAKNEVNELGVLGEMNSGLASMLSNLKRGNVKRPSLRLAENQEKGSLNLMKRSDELTEVGAYQEAKLASRPAIDLSGVKLKSTGSKIYN